MFESSKEENLLMNKKITNQIEEIDRLQQENKSLKVKLGSRVVHGPNQAYGMPHGPREYTHCLAQLGFVDP